MNAWTWYEWGAGLVLGALGFWLISTALDMALDWLLQRQVNRELDEMNQTAPVEIPQMRKSEENGPDGA